MLIDSHEINSKSPCMSIERRLPSRGRKNGTTECEKGQAKRATISVTVSLILFHFFPLPLSLPRPDVPSFLQTRPIVPRGTEIFNWKRSRARATFIIPWSMIKIISPAMSAAENRCVEKERQTERKENRGWWQNIGTRRNYSLCPFPFRLVNNFPRFLFLVVEFERY